MDDLRADFLKDGIVVLRGLCEYHVPRWQEAWRGFYNPSRTHGWNPVEVCGPFPSVLEEIKNNRELVGNVEEALNAAATVYNFRFVVKDEASSNAVFLHQDCGYHIGSAPKLSAFVALSSVIPENGGLQFWTGTHKYGYLGDVGEINPAIIKRPKVICPVLAPGDVVLMDSCLWHQSGPKVCGPDRILADVIFQMAGDPSREIKKDASIFVRSRTSRLKEMQEKLKKAGIE